MNAPPDPDAMLTRLRSRRTAPGMLDLDALRPGTREAGLGLGTSDLVRRLRGRLSGDGMPAVAPGELILAQPGDPTEMPDSDTVSRVMATAPTRGPAAVSSPPVVAPVDSTAAPVPGALEEFGAVPPDEPAPTAASPRRRAQGGLTGGGAAQGLPSVAGIDSTAAMPASAETASLPAMDPAALPFAVAELPAPMPQQPALALPRIAAASSLSAVSALPGMAVGAPFGFDDPMEPAYAPVAGAPYAPPATSVQPHTPLTAAAAPAASAPFEDLSDRIARDLRRRLAVERERQGRPRWKD